MKVTRSFRIGGVAERVSPDWDERRELGIAQVRALVHWAKDLEAAGRLKITGPVHDGDYRRYTMEIDLGPAAD